MSMSTNLSTDFVISISFQASKIYFYTYCLQPFNCRIICRLKLLILFSCLFFTTDHYTFAVYGQTCHDYINHVIVFGLCSELLMRLYYDIHSGFL